MVDPLNPGSLPHPPEPSSPQPQHPQTPGEPVFSAVASARPMRPAAPVKRGRGVAFWFALLFGFALIGSVLLNFGLLASLGLSMGSSGGDDLIETFHSGSKTASDKVAIIKISGTIMPPNTKRILNIIKHVGQDQNVKGVLLVVDSPGGLVADSHQIYHRLKEMREKHNKPTFVAMQRLAASGGYYVAMGAGPQAKIFVEPTTWTGSIGVIIPRYDVSKLTEKWDIKIDPLTTGPYKDALSPFREMSEGEKQVWQAIMDDAFDRFIQVIEENRENLDEAAVRKLATGQVYTAEQSIENGLADQIGYDDEALEALKASQGLDEVKVVTYRHTPTLSDLFIGGGETSAVRREVDALIDATVPRAMYLFSWAPALPEL